MIRTPPTSTLTINPTIVPRGLATNISTYFRHNWRDAVTVRTQWRTFPLNSKLRSREQRIGMLARPQITVSSDHQALDYPQLRRLIQHAYNQSPSFQVPVDSPTTLLAGTDLSMAGAIHCDAAPILSVTPVGPGFTLGVDLLDGYRFYPNMRVWIVTPDASDVDVSAGVAQPGVLHSTTANVTRTEITVTPAGSFVPTTDMLVVPAFDAVPVLTVDGSSETCSTPSFTIEAQEIIGENQLLPSRGVNVAAFFDDYQGFPIFFPEHNFAEPYSLGFTRDGNIFDLGSGQQSVLDGETPLHTNSFTIAAERADFWIFKFLFDSRRGSLLPMWIVSPTVLDVNYAHPGGTAVPLLPDLGVTFPKALGFENQVTGEVVVRRIVDQTATYLLEEALDTGTYNVFDAYLGRFTEDYIDEEWIMCHYASCTFSTVELTDAEVLEINP